MKLKTFHMKSFKTNTEVSVDKFSNETFITIVCGCSHREINLMKIFCLNFEDYFEEIWVLKHHLDGNFLQFAWVFREKIPNPP